MRAAGHARAAFALQPLNLFDRVEATTGIEPSGRLVEQVMSTEPRASARTVEWIVDNGSSHAGMISIRRMREVGERPPDPSADHASWRNPIELYFSIVQRIALTPNDFASPEELAVWLLSFGQH